MFFIYAFCYVYIFAFVIEIIYLKHRDYLLYHFLLFYLVGKPSLWSIVVFWSAVNRELSEVISTVSPRDKIDTVSFVVVPFLKL